MGQWLGSASRRAVAVVRGLVTVLVLMGGVQAGVALGDEPVPGTYRMQGGKVDPGTFSGWVVFHTACFICHGRDAVGTDIAPSLLNSMKTLDRQAFANKVLTRYRIAMGTLEASTAEQASVRALILSEVQKSERGARGQVAMPGWQENPGIQAHLLDLYAYLKARSDGALGPGQPTVTAK